MFGWENTAVKACPLPKTGCAFKTKLGDSGIVSSHQVALAFACPDSRGATLPAGLSSAQLFPETRCENTGLCAKPRAAPAPAAPANQPAKASVRAWGTARVPVPSPRLCANRPRFRPPRLRSGWRGIRAAQIPTTTLTTAPPAAPAPSLLLSRQLAARFGAAAP